MIGKIQHSIVAILAAFLLSSCESPETPQQVAEYFWQAVIEDRPAGVIQYSTLVNVKDYDKFSMDWNGYQPNWGKVTIENNNASVESTFTSLVGAELKERKLTTYLVTQNEKWKVDYQKTRDAMQAHRAGGLFEKLNQIGRELSEQLEDSAGELNTELQQLEKKLQELSDQVASDAAESVEKFADELDKSLEKLQEQIDRALKEKPERAPERNDGSLQEI